MHLYEMTDDSANSYWHDPSIDCLLLNDDPRIPDDPDQQIRGRGSPTSMSTIRVPPNSVFSSTSVGGSSFTVPMTAAPSPRGCDRRAARAACVSAPSTTMTRRPSQAT